MKKIVPILLLMSLNPIYGLCNGTRLITENILKYKNILNSILISLHFTYLKV